MKQVASFAIPCALVMLIACAPRTIPTASPASPTATPLSVAGSETLEPSPPESPAATETPTPAATETATPSPTATTRSFLMATTTAISYDHNPRSLLIEADVFGGLAPVPRDAHVPKFRLYGDGFVVFAGERALLSTGLDAVVRVGHLSELEIQNLLAYLNQVGFFTLDSFYQPRPVPADQPTAFITVYLNKVKTVRVYAPGFLGTPQTFSDAFDRITRTIPADAQPFVLVDGYLQATLAGSVSDLGPSATLGNWPISSVRLADAVEGLTVAGNTFSQILTFTPKNLSNGLYREGDRVYRVRFVPNLPRAVHLTNWVSVILDAPREFDGRAFDIVGYYRGANLYGEARGNPPGARNEWVIADEGGAMFVTGAAPPGLNPSSRADAWTIVRLRAVVAYVRFGTSYLEGRRVEITSSNASPTLPPVPSLIVIANADAAIAAVKAKFAEVAKIQKAGAGVIGASTNITVLERPDGWDLAFLEGSGDCPAGCINNHYYYFSVKKDGRVNKVGEYSSSYVFLTNSFETSGTPMWGIPK